MTIEPRRKKTGLLFDINGHVQSKKKVRSLKYIFFLYKKRGYSIHVAKSKPMISCLVTANGICVFSPYRQKPSFVMTRHILQTVMDYLLNML